MQAPNPEPFVFCSGLVVGEGQLVSDAATLKTRKKTLLRIRRCSVESRTPPLLLEPGRYAKISEQSRRITAKGLAASHVNGDYPGLISQGLQHSSPASPAASLQVNTLQQMMQNQRELQV